jgi:predicted dienelactone hydrolase
VLHEFIAARPLDVRFALDQVVSRLDGMIDATRVGVTGHSFGGWTTLAVAAGDARIRAALALAPAGGTPVLGGDVFGDALAAAGARAVPTVFVVAERDTLLPLDGMHRLVGRTPGTTRLVVIRDADHLHFCDDVERVHELFRTMPVEPLFVPLVKGIRPIGELCPGAHAHDVVRSVGLAHFDATLKGDEAAAAFVAGDVVGALADRGVRVDAPAGASR